MPGIQLLTTKSSTMKIFCVGRNYSEHAKELNNEVPPEPVIFLKPKSALLAPNANFSYPQFTNELHYAAELVLHISKNGKYIDEAQAGKYFDYISVEIDFTARDVQNELKKKGLPWEKAKAWDCSAVLGAWRPKRLSNPRLLLFPMASLSFLIRFAHPAL